MPTFEPEELGPRETYLLLTSVVAPRPIAWVASRSSAGVRNLAPHSYFNVISAEPPIVHFTSAGTKDTLANVRATGEFTISMVDESLLDVMNTTSADFPPEVDEFQWAGVEPVESEAVAVPWVAASPAALECTVRTVLSMGEGHMVFGDVRRIHIADRAWTGQRVDPEGLGVIGRLAGSAYLLPREVTKRRRPTYADLRQAGPARGADAADVGDEHA